MDNYIFENLLCNTFLKLSVPLLLEFIKLFFYFSLSNWSFHNLSSVLAVKDISGTTIVEAFWPKFLCKSF